MKLTWINYYKQKHQSNWRHFAKHFFFKQTEYESNFFGGGWIALFKVLRWCCLSLLLFGLELYRCFPMYLHKFDWNRACHLGFVPLHLQNFHNQFFISFILKYFNRWAFILFLLKRQFYAMSAVDNSSLFF